MTRSGGEADKFGNSYEGAWTIHQMLRVLAGRAEAITVEDIGERAEGSEFTLATLHHGDEAHQVKRKQGTAPGWTPRRLHDEGVFQAARGHVEQGRQFHFVSTITAPKLSVLADYARRSASAESLRADWLKSGELKPEFDYLSGTVYGSDRVAWQTLRGIWTHCQDEGWLRQANDVLAALLLSGAPATPAALSLGDMAVRNLGVRLTAAAIEARLPEYELTRAHLVSNSTVAQDLAAALASWKDNVSRAFLHPLIMRSESGVLSAALRSGATPVTVVAGASGSGKSGVLWQSVKELEADRWPVLALRLDRLETLTSTSDLGRQLELGVSPVVTLAAVAGDAPCLLVVDQVDAVSFASGRMTGGFDTIVDLIREAAAFPQMRVLLACRTFDIDNDHRIRQLVADKKAARVDVGPLTRSQVAAAVGSMGLLAEQLSDKQRSLLASPLNLVLLGAIADQPDALSFASASGLMAAYWDRKSRDCASRRPAQSPPRFPEVIGALANAMSRRQQLWARTSVLDAVSLGPDAEVLASEHVLIRDGNRYAFFHESFFDYAFARLWLDRDQSLVDFLLADEQALFRRAQVRQILQHVRDDDQERFVREAESVLSHDKIRFHIKVAVLAVLQSLSAPSAGEWQIVKRLISADGLLAARLCVAIGTPAWFDRLDQENVIEQWLASNDAAAHEHAMRVVVGAIKQRTDRIAQLIAPHAGTGSEYVGWLGWVTRFADIHESRPLFDLVLDAVRRGDYEGGQETLWMAVFGLGQHQPGWAVELLAAWLIERPEASGPDDSAQQEILNSREHNLLELASCGAQGAPVLYAERLIPYLMAVMARTEQRTAQELARDRFSFREQEPGPVPDLGDVLLHGAAIAVRILAAQDPVALEPTLDLLAAARHDSAQWLLYEALRAAGAQYAERAGALLLEGDHRFPCGYLSDIYWTTRQLLQATTPHMPDDQFARLEAAVIAYRPSWENRQQACWASFELLSAMAEDRLSGTGRRRLGELRRRFNLNEPAQPGPVFRSGFVRSPIPDASAALMTNDQWISAMDRHRTEQVDYSTLTGGVSELSSVLRDQAGNDPARFARLALRLAADTHPAYVNAILEALMQTQNSVASTLVFDAVRHIAALGNAKNDQALVMALRQHLGGDLPEDIIQIVLDRALHATDPSEDAWSTLASNGEPYFGGDIFANGMNCARGQAALTLGDLLIHDTDGQRTALVAPSLSQLSDDPSVAVRSTVAHVLGASFRHAAGEALAAFEQLIVADDRLLAASPVIKLMLYIGATRPAVAEPIIRRMLKSADEIVQRQGGYLAAREGLEFGLGDLLTAARRSDAPAIRSGAADLCARSLPYTSDAAAAADALSQFFSDPDQEVRKAAAHVAAELRSKPLEPFRELLKALVASPSFTEALSQLTYTLQAAPDRIGEIILQCTKRFIDLYGQDAGDIATSAAGDAQMITQLTLRAYAQAPDQEARASILDLIDDLLVINAIGAQDAVDQAER